ncbi:dihydrolipoamide acetyltransferase family protein [Ruegeria marina]|uniref:Dihydrolipoamide acetyltransferase component of pyruvate dehydrogenase complex n=1 Tax=Ruegeria marina TaxID=639004 RepID=A0A1G6UYD6_9RHOB|nr:dihydrolipoamide acetyltransferase family protein [Ruegeria marina]SDD46308.1 pyruvate dehydrogenase E2 component (dihydrolipoamide acetyltransferase) [Ruegeria marina]
MKQEFRLQDPGEGIHEVDVLEIMIAEGDEVSEGQDILVVESDKAAVELPSPFAGRVEEIRVSVGDTVEVGKILLVIEDGAGASEPSDGDTEDEKTSEDDAGPDAQDDAEAEADTRTTSGEDRQDTTSQEPSAPPDRKTSATSESPEAKEKDTQHEDGRPVPKASPAARKAAKDAGLDLADISATGSDGQITVKDVQAASGKADAKATSSERDGFGPIKRRALGSLRAATARAMSRSWQNIPHAVHHDRIDITEIERWRRDLSEDAGRVSLTAIMTKAVATLLPEEPRFNASFDAEAREIVERGYYNINIAVATEHGLVTPVIAEADRKSLSEIHEELVDLAEKARKRSLRKANLSGGTFTITNVGSLGGHDLMPIINPPQTAILGLARASLQPVVTSGFNDIASPEMEARLILPVALSFDHRAIDGADAARFADKLARLLGDPATFTLEI